MAINLYNAINTFFKWLANKKLKPIIFSIVDTTYLTFENKSDSLSLNHKNDWDCFNFLLIIPC